MGRNYKEINQLKLPPLYLAFGFTVKNKHAYFVSFAYRSDLSPCGSRGFPSTLAVLTVSPCLRAKR